MRQGFLYTVIAKNCLYVTLRLFPLAQNHVKYTNFHNSQKSTKDSLPCVGHVNIHFINTAGLATKFLIVTESMRRSNLEWFLKIS